MSQVSPQLRSLGKALYEARMRQAWGRNWQANSRWPADDQAWREYPHHPVAEVDLILVQARAALDWWAAQ